MINGKKVLAIIPARGGSKGLKRKNIKDLCGKPLIAWTIEMAKKSKYIDYLMMSTEDDEIIKVANNWGCDVPFVRPEVLAQDSTSTIDVILYVINKLPKFDYVVLLQPTSPLRNCNDIDACIEKCVEKKAKSCVSVTETNKSPYWMYHLNKNRTIKPIIENDVIVTRRQELPKTYVLNGAVYVAESKWLCENKTFLTNETVAYVMPQERSVDIDTKLDFAYARAIIQED